MVNQNMVNQNNQNNTLEDLFTGINPNTNTENNTMENIKMVFHFMK